MATPCAIRQLIGFNLAEPGEIPVRLLFGHTERSEHNPKTVEIPPRTHNERASAPLRFAPHPKTKAEQKNTCTDNQTNISAQKRAWLQVTVRENKQIYLERERETHTRAWDRSRQTETDAQGHEHEQQHIKRALQDKPQTKQKKKPMHKKILKQPEQHDKWRESKTQRHM